MIQFFDELDYSALFLIEAWECPATALEYPVMQFSNELESRDARKITGDYNLLENCITGYSRAVAGHSQASMRNNAE